MTTLVALGDSVTVGMGDPAADGGWRGWAALLAQTLDQPEMHNLAVLGALSGDVELRQLPAALGLKPDLATVVVGINDTLRGGTAWLFRRSRDLVPALTALALCELLADDHAPERDIAPETVTT
jgi:lysophospholipase L1-like esterase